MKDLMEEINDYREQLWPDLLGYQLYNMIAFNDLLELGYVRAERRNSLDFNHSKLVLMNLSRFHAMSKVLLERGLITSEDQGKVGIAEGPVMESYWIPCLLTDLSDAMEGTWGNEWKDPTRDMSRHCLSEGLWKILVGDCQETEGSNRRTTNMLFKYLEEEDDIPVSVKIVDYQMVNINSFVWDVAFFLITSTIPNVRRSRLNELFLIYQRSLEKNLKIFNYTGYIPTSKDVTSEWERIEYAHLCYYMYQPLMTAETKTAFDLEKLTTRPPKEVIEDTVFRDGKAMQGIG